MKHTLFAACLLTLTSILGIQPASAQAPAHISMHEQDQGALDAFYHQPKANLPMYVTKTDWSDADEDKFSTFVQTLGKSISSGRCGTLTKCMQDPTANIFAKDDPPGLIFYTDCAKFPYFLRSYFAYHMGLPFGYVTRFEMSKKPYASESDLDSDLATAQLDDSPYGNQLLARGGSNEASRPGQSIEFLSYITKMFNEVSTRTLRTGPLTPGADLSDVYPVKINLQGIRPGTVVTATGHAMVVWNVRADGLIQIIDGHPGAFVQAHPLDKTKLQRSRPDQGLGFYRWRPIHLVGAQLGQDGTFTGGKLVTENDRQLYAEGKYSLEQWFGPGSTLVSGDTVNPNAWKSAFKQVGFFSFLDAQMRNSQVRVRADIVVATIFDDLCAQIKSREDTINGAINAGITQQAHPDAIVANIFGSSDATWEAYSTPGADGRLKDQVRNAVETAVSQFHLVKQQSANIYFDGNAQDFARLLQTELRATAAKCPASYINSAGKQVTLTFNQVLSRLNRLSFDPYMCAEKLWGASGAEMSTCRDLDQHSAWYNAESFIRNTVGKQNDEGVMVVRSPQPITLNMLQDQTLLDQPEDSRTNLGTRQVPLMNLDGYLGSSDFLSKLN